MPTADKAKSKDALKEDAVASSDGVVENKEKVAPKTKRTRTPAKKKGVTVFINQSDRDINVFNHVIPAKGKKEFVPHIAEAMAQTPIVENLVRIGTLKIV